MRPRDHCVGSSPLTRGKRRLDHVDQPRRRLIPAHAGKTPVWQARSKASRAHPRSRGENRYVTGPDNLCSGSSPLTRGKRPERPALDQLTRLIPAHAGKTRFRPRNAQGPRAHPRSRGENLTDLVPALAGVGSSPLTRGKQVVSLDKVAPQRLIPAHAGKTHAHPCGSARKRAHPRSRGENAKSPSRYHWYHGSSPLTRGKQLST